MFEVIFLIAFVVFCATIVFVLTWPDLRPRPSRRISDEFLRKHESQAESESVKTVAESPTDYRNPPRCPTCQQPWTGSG